jgi:hypothetical protein
MEIEKLTGMPGLIIKYDNKINPGVKPERIEGIGPPPAMFTIREQYLRDIEELAGTFDVIKGQKPSGVEAFSALQLLVERSQSRFSPVFQARGNAYKNWYKYALELEREFGQEERVKASMSSGRKWSFQNFKRTQLQGSVSIIVEDGSNAPKTSLGRRAAIEHASQLGMLNMTDPDQQYAALKEFGLTNMIPTLDIHIQAALQKQQAFEEWIGDPAAVQESAVQADQALQGFEAEQAAIPPPVMGPVDPATGVAPPPEPLPQPPSPLNSTPLKWLPWYNPVIHKQEFMKWANSDRIRETIKVNPETEGFLTMHLAEMDLKNMEAMMAAAGPAMGAPAGAGAAMANSNQNSAPAGNKPQPAQGV